MSVANPFSASTKRGFHREITRNFLLALLMCFFAAGTSQANESRWDTQSENYVVENGSFNCSGCHSPNTENTSLQVSVPSSVAHDATTANVTLQGFDNSGGKSFWRYRTTGADTQVNDARNNRQQQITFSSNANPVVLRYCMLDAAGSSGSSGREWHCTTASIPRDPAPNEPPEITSSQPDTQNLIVGEDTFSFNVTASDDDGTPTVEVISTALTVASVTSNGSGSYTVTPLSEGSASIRITATDSDDETDTQSFTVNVAEPEETNEPPTITSSNPGDQSLRTDDADFQFAVTATDDSSTPDITVTSSNSTAVTVNELGSNSFSVSPQFPGSSTITITATDADSATDIQAFTVTVSPATIDPPADNPPAITSSNPGNQSLEENGTEFSFNVEASDDLSTPSISVSSSDPSVVAVSNPGSNTFTLSPGVAGVSNIVVTATDESAQIATQTFIVTVTPAVIGPPDVAPIVVLVDVDATVRLTPGGIYSVEVSVQDEFVDRLTYRVESSDTAVATANYLSEGRLTIDAVAEGSATIQLVVTDILMLEASVSVNVIVESGNQAPIAQADSYIVAQTGVAIALDVLSNDSDPDGDDLSIRLDSASSARGNTLQISGSDVLFTANEALTENDSFSYRAADPSGAQSESVVVTLVPSDFDGDGTFDVLDNCPVLANGGQVDMDSDGLGDLCDPDPDGDGQPGISGQPFESGRELVQMECLTCHLTGVSGAPLFGDDAAWDARISAAGGEPADLLPSVLNGLGAMPAFASQYSSLELIQAIRYLTGRENDNNEPPPGAIVDLDSDEVDDSIDNCPTVPNQTQADSDSNGIGDLCEPLADNDGDGYPFSLDDDDSNATRLLAGTSSSNSSVFSATVPMTLGRVARASAEANNFASAAVVLSQTQFAQASSNVFPGISIDADRGYSSLMGIVNVSVQVDGSNSNDRAELFIELAANLPLNPVIRIFNSSNGMWRDFDNGSPNAIGTLPKINGLCSVDGSANYIDGLNAGDQCLKITLSDGGFNDADGSTNGQVEIIANIARLLDLDNDSNGPDVVELNPSKSGGGNGPLFLALLLMWAGGIRVGRALARE